MLASRFSQFLAADPGRLHFAAHSHHPWPDATREAQERYWLDSTRLADRKWDLVFGEVVPAAQRHVARLLHLADPGQVAFANNTHEFVNRLYSCLEASRPLRVLTTAHEFHSFRRQTRRLQEAGRVEVEAIPGEPWESFDERFAAAAARGPWDLVWLSHVFYDSGFVVRDLDRIVAAAPDQAMVAIDGYHAFCALPIDLSRIRERAFYLGGGYKYAMAGEGAAFLAIPPGCELRPADTGWFAAFDRLGSGPGEAVAYADNAFRFWGATFDPTGVYRFIAARDMMDAAGVTVEQVHRHALALQKHFLDGLDRRGIEALSPAQLVPPREAPRGNFLAFDVDDAAGLYRRISEAGIAIDRRERRLRFGFGVYQDAAMVERLLERLAEVLQ